MPGKKEYFLILLVLIGIPLLSYSISYSYFKNNSQESFNFSKTTEQIKNIVKQNEPISILFIGDIMLDRTIRKDGELYGYSNLFSCLKDEFSKYDEIVGNLEGTVTDFDSVSKNASYESPESFRFTFDKKAVRELFNIGLSIVSLGNNHIRDFGEEGIVQTVLNAHDIGLDTFGDPRKGSQRYIIKNIKDTKIAFIPYNQFFGTKDDTLLDLKITQELSDIQIIFAHWGDEYVPTKKSVKTLAYLFIDNGADLVIGAHPHVIQEKETYLNTPIYYSLGNFIFDQYWEESVRTGLTVSIEIQDKKIKVLDEKKVESKRHTGTCFIKNPHQTN